MSDKIEYVEPTQEHVGQMVEVRDSEAACWRTAKLTALIESDSDNSRFVAKKQGHCYSMSWKHARIPRPLTYAERRARCGLKVGDRVKFVRAWKPNELGGRLEFFDEMKPAINQVGVIVDIKSSISVEFESVDSWRCSVDYAQRSNV